MTEKIIIIGGGPAGLAAAVYAARAELSPLVVAGSPPGGQLTLTSEVENYPGHDSILGPELVDKMRAQAQKFETRFIDDNVSSVSFKKGMHEITLSGGEKLTAQTILIATGASALWLGLESETRLRGAGVSACATCDGFFFKSKVVAVVGGGDTAMEEAQTLSKFASKVYIIHRKGEFRASKIMQKRVLENPKIEVLWNTEIVEVLGKDRVEGLKLKSTTSNTLTTDYSSLATNGLFLGIGHKPNTEFLKDSGVLLDEKGYVVTSGIYAWRAKRESTLDLPSSGINFAYQYSTSVDGVFAAGDVADFEFRQAGTAVGMGIAAVLEIERYLAGIEDL
ncbi:hypothetical protein A2799_01880 [Candidatus Roizmanbacteria bacterium RIFCSPHIGHO2_01_FULL_39_24]|uniref:FAD/NAD(P)-binding domain-containing protein n=1 Tax=Candidatus Roizmanbacteria bacterium RIFCSPHIGHO2_01_FULL_39_24 TaxID=1802032 RepID=A0A1F7GFT7_9BACT|nr:MAG: hypothetical protein A2799_01880 [Candidatus Roizmanbacteria bacterium RIFCSPHIGHO2_01_FULL_39_24]